MVRIPVLRSNGDKFYLQVTVMIKLRLCMPPELFAKQVNIVSVLRMLAIVRLEVMT